MLSWGRYCLAQYILSRDKSLFDSLKILLAHPWIWLWPPLLLLLWSALCVFLTALRQRALWQGQQALAQREWQLQEAKLVQEAQHLRDALSRAEQAQDSAHSELERRARRLQELEVRVAEYRVLLSEQERAHQAEKHGLEATRQSLAQEFELLANRLFDAKQAHFNRDSKANIEQVITPFQKQLQDFYRRLDEAHRADSAHRNQLLGQISELHKQSLQISSDAVNLTNALKGDNKLQGNWGEVVLVRLLEQSGLQRGREYQLQVSSTNGDGRRFQPDVVVHLPEQRDVIIDSKVSLVAYERYCNAATESEREQALKAHLDSIKGHLKGLIDKNYAHLEQIRSLDFVLLFVPIEGAYALLLEHRGEILAEAYRKGVVVVSPSSLMVALRTIEALWHRDKQDRNVAQIVASAGQLYDQFVLFISAMDELGAGLQKAEAAYQTAYRRLSKGRGNLVKRVDSLKHWGARATRALPEHIIAQARQSDTPIEVADAQDVGAEDAPVNGDDVRR